MMTNEINKMFEENKNLIYTAINTYVKCPGRYGLNDYDDLFQIGSIGLVKAIENYNPEQGKFSTYAMRIMRNYLYNALRDAGDIQDTVSLNDEWIEMNEDTAFASTTSLTDELMMKDGLEIIGSCSKRYGGIAEKGAKAIQMMLLGYECSDIAAMYDVDAKTITAWMSRARQKLQKEPELLRLLDRA